MLRTNHSLFWISFKYLEIQSSFSLFLAQKLQKFFPLFFCHIPPEQNVPLSCNPIYPDSQSCEDFQLLELPSYSRVTNQHLNMAHQHASLSFRHFTETSCQCTVSVS